MEVLVVFASKSNERTYSRIVEKLKAHGISFDFRICSAHKSPKLMDEVLKGEYDLIIAGAGLAAHLAGAIASKTTVPVIGVPCKDNFDGLDAFLSTVQMPPGVSVLSTGVDGNPAVFEWLFEKHKGVNITGGKKNKSIDQCTELLNRFGIKQGTLQIHFYDLDHENPKAEALNVPLKIEPDARDAITFKEKSRNVLTFGMNNGKNAALFVAQLLGEDISSYRKELEKNVREDDKKCN